MNIDGLLKDPKHHAYVIFSSSPQFEKEDSVISINFDKGILIDDVRSLQEVISLNTGKDACKYVITAPSITVQSQNSLLKTLEEIPKGVFVFLCIPSGTVLLDTLVSRCVLVEEEDFNENKKFKGFFKKNSKEKLEILEGVWELGEGVRHAEILAFIQYSEVYLDKIKDEGKDLDFVKKLYSTISQVRSAIESGGFSKTTLQLFAFV